jgi:hypothetical protein
VWVPDMGFDENRYQAVTTSGPRGVAPRSTLPSPSCGRPVPSPSPLASATTPAAQPAPPGRHEPLNDMPESSLTPMVRGSSFGPHNAVSFNGVSAHTG